MKTELKHHLPPLIIVFILTSALWLIRHDPSINIVLLFFGLSLGSFLLDIDHLIYWFFTQPHLQESQLAQIAWKKGDFKTIIQLFSVTHHQHQTLIFHHFTFQIILALISIFAFTSTNSILGLSTLLSLNLHLLVDEIVDYRHSPTHLQDWLFSKFPRQLPVKYLRTYLIFFFVLYFIFFLLLAI